MRPRQARQHKDCASIHSARPIVSQKRCGVDRLDLAHGDAQRLLQQHHGQHQGRQRAVAQDGQPVEEGQDQLAGAPLAEHGHDVGAAGDVDRQAGNRSRAPVRREDMDQAAGRADHSHEDQEVERQPRAAVVVAGRGEEA